MRRIPCIPICRLSFPMSRVEQSALFYGVTKIDHLQWLITLSSLPHILCLCLCVVHLSNTFIVWLVIRVHEAVAQRRCTRIVASCLTRIYVSSFFHLKLFFSVSKMSKYRLRSTKPVYHNHYHIWTLNIVRQFEHVHACTASEYTGTFYWLRLLFIHYFVAKIKLKVLSKSFWQCWRTLSCTLTWTLRTPYVLCRS